ACGLALEHLADDLGLAVPVREPIDVAARAGPQAILPFDARRAVAIGLAQRRRSVLAIDRDQQMLLAEVELARTAGASDHERFQPIRPGLRVDGCHQPEHECSGVRQGSHGDLLGRPTREPKKGSTAGVEVSACQRGAACSATNCTNRATYFSRRARIGSSTIAPLSSNTFAALPICRRAPKNGTM